MSIEESIKSIEVAGMTSDAYFQMSEERKIVTPENIGGLIDYPALFKAMQDDRELRPALSEAMSTGRAMNDYLSLETSEFLKKYLVADGPINPKTGKAFGTETKAYQEWRMQQERTPVTTEQFDMFAKMAAAYNEHAFIKSMSGMSYRNNVVLRTTINGVDCACSIDRLYTSDKTAVAVDVKTTDDLASFARTADRLFYRHQQALVMLILASSGIATAQSRIAAVEKGKMPRCGVFGLKDQDAYAGYVAEALEDYADSLKSGMFGTRFEAQRLI